jgi:hypothetical protein
MTPLVKVLHEYLHIEMIPNECIMSAILPGYLAHTFKIIMF